MSSDDPSDSGRDNPDDLPPTSEGQGRWLGTVRSWIGGGAGSGSGDQGDDNSDAVPDSAPSPALSAEEIRRRRLQKMEASMSQKVQLSLVQYCFLGGNSYRVQVLLCLNQKSNNANLATSRYWSCLCVYTRALLSRMQCHGEAKVYFNRKQETKSI